ncbi:hypothetical protein [Exiguobacterium sp. s193]|uniref:hypothetical protein n=1 Tax=Exiguobacterium sp. s193 TaxID=2751207 RepID=UPI001BEA2175|nr:hypothetical protein [Exiguobacterium sp. s193]
MKKQLAWLISSFLIGVGCFLFLQRDHHSAAFHEPMTELTPHAVVESLHKKAAFKLVPKEVYWTEALSDTQAVAYAETKTTRYLIVIRRQEAAYVVTHVTRRTVHGGQEWAEAEVIDTDTGRFLIVVGENDRRLIDHLTIAPYKVSLTNGAEQTHAIEAMTRTLDVATKERFHTIQKLPQAFPKSLFFDLHAVDASGTERFRSLSNSID